ncbi:MAG: hypothetical protein GEU99_22720 [Luteitalea sp.]|nr:hypothetical protein [Luteitalea sp.]
MSDTDLVRAATYVNRFEADLAKTTLEAAGVPVLVRADDCGGMRPHLWLGGIELFVRSEDAEKAAEVLACTPINLEADDSAADET